MLHECVRALKEHCGLIRGIHRQWAINPRSFGDPKRPSASGQAGRRRSAAENDWMLVICETKVAHGVVPLQLGHAATTSGDLGPR